MKNSCGKVVNRNDNGMDGDVMRIDIDFTQC